MFSFQNNPGGSINPKDFWLENCNLNDRFKWLNKQDVEPLWLQVEGQNRAFELELLKNQEFQYHFSSVN